VDVVYDGLSTPSAGSPLQPNSTSLECTCVVTPSTVVHFPLNSWFPSLKTKIVVFPSPWKGMKRLSIRVRGIKSVPKPKYQRDSLYRLRLHIFEQCLRALPWQNFRDNFGSSNPEVALLCTLQGAQPRCFCCGFLMYFLSCVARSPGKYSPCASVSTSKFCMACHKLVR